MATVSCVAWVPRGKAAPNPKMWEASEEQLAKLEQTYGIDSSDLLEQAGNSRPELDLDAEFAGDSSDEDEGKIVAGGKSADKSADKSAADGAVENDADMDDDAEMKVEGAEDLELDGYDEEDSAAAFGNTVLSKQDHDLAFNDPLLTHDQQESDSEDEEDRRIKPTDNVFVAASCEDDQCKIFDNFCLLRCYARGGFRRYVVLPEWYLAP